MSPSDGDRRSRHFSLAGLALLLGYVEAVMALAVTPWILLGSMALPWQRAVFWKDAGPLLLPLAVVALAGPPLLIVALARNLLAAAAHLSPLVMSLTTAAAGLAAIYLSLPAADDPPRGKVFLLCSGGAAIGLLLSRARSRSNAPLTGLS